MRTGHDQDTTGAARPGCIDGLDIKSISTLTREI